MRIGILTLPLHTNYGGILQAYALQTVLERMGHEAILLDKGWIKKSGVRKILSWMKWTLKFLFSKQHLITPQMQEKMGKNIRSFIFTYINPRIEFRKISDVERLGLNAIIVGSDQVWRKYYSPKNIAFYYLDFAKDWNIKRISYAASFGIEQWDYSQEETACCAELLRKFVGVSVREDTGKELCLNYLKRNAEVVLDPTLLLTTNDYIQLVQQSSKEFNGDLLCYILDNNENIQGLVDIVSHSFDLKPYYTNLDESKYSLFKGQAKLSVENWLKSFAHAKFVVTDSFHGCVFSIIFNKPFFVYGNKRRGMTRFTSLLSQFGLEDRLVSSVDEVKKKLEMGIDWQHVNKCLAILRQSSFAFLETNLSK